MITGKCKLHCTTNYNFSIFHHWFLYNRADGKNGGVGLIDYRCKFIDSKHPKIRDGKRTSFHFVWCKLFVTSSNCIVFDLRTNLRQCHFISKSNNRNNQPIWNSHCDSDVYMVIELHAIVKPTRIDLRMFFKRQSCCFYNDIIK